MPCLGTVKCEKSKEEVCEGNCCSVLLGCWQLMAPKGILNTYCYISGGTQGPERRNHEWGVQCSHYKVAAPSKEFTWCLLRTGT